MSGHNFTPKKIGKEFPKTRQGKNTKYFTEGTASLLNANLVSVKLPPVSKLAASSLT